MRLHLLFLLLPVLLVAQSQDPWIGAWRLNAAKSGQTNSPYKRVTMKIVQQDDGLSVSYDMVGTRGGVTHVEWVGRFDGKDYPVQGVDYFATNAYSRIDDHSYTITTKRDGRTASSIKVTVSGDGRTLTAVTTGRNAEGQDISTTSIYDKL